MMFQDEFMEILQVLMEEPVAKRKSPAPARARVSANAGEGNQTRSVPQKGAAS
jgi:hypothetical protein